MCVCVCVCVCVYVCVCDLRVFALLVTHTNINIMVPYYVYIINSCFGPSDVFPQDSLARIHLPLTRDGISVASFCEF
jgi:hypothetical protein